MSESLPTLDYPALLLAKQQRLQALLAPFKPSHIEVFASPEQHFRMRAEFRLWHEGDDLYHIMFDKVRGERYRVDGFPIASELINRMMTALLPELKVSAVLRHKLFQIDYLSTLSGQIAVSLLYHKALDAQWESEARALKVRLQSQGFDVQLIGRARKQKICLDHDWVDETLNVNGRDFHYRQVENSFTQPNARMNIEMLQWAQLCTQGAQGDLLELYCGNGNFSIALAGNFARVLATEIAKSSVQAAQHNLQANGIDNVRIIRMSTEEVTQALRGERTFNRLQGVNLTDYQCNTVLVDPPRAGLDKETLSMLSTYPQILYISCNPHTLVDNLATLSQTHRIARAALFDQFPYTDHIETGVWLVKYD
ncbi:tRNA (uridine(54)-C5)-methyltransferase TrmA [Pasteurellaceae bacterium HPA106]|uniref:tRNA (uridine(54)-C5)-methyltransferase TrmA n=1 Tax=Spirabiliibacterium pneumoniae TaxID=221400 RepID=UPI001AADDC3B|nr:tRNA (uridine(54)-C5)-methyltransferase TrmA [Spirabiliibacterium pneumoniae]MBE2895883.1 tRNA (uridine(54)-C5)-methyltransferase TrmA [Spirabiliibacterium pneumoniae]